MTDSQRDESEIASTDMAPPVIADDDAPVGKTTEDQTAEDVFDIPSCMPGEALYNCDLLTPEEYNAATNTGAQLIQLVSEMLRTVDESIRESEAKGENMLSMNESSVIPDYLLEEPRPAIQLAIKHAPEQYREESADDSHRSSAASFRGFPDKLSIRETLPSEADPFAIREGMTLAWKDVNLTVVSNYSLAFQNVSLSYSYGRTISCAYRKVEAKYRTVISYKVCGVRFRKKRPPRSWARPELERHH